MPESILALLDVLSLQTSSIVSNVASYLAKHDESIANLMLTRLLKGTTQAHAALAGRICCLGGSSPTSPPPIAFSLSQPNKD